MAPFILPISTNRFGDPMLSLLTQENTNPASDSGNSGDYFANLSASSRSTRKPGQQNIPTEDVDDSKEEDSQSSGQPTKKQQALTISSRILKNPMLAAMAPVGISDQDGAIYRDVFMPKASELKGYMHFFKSELPSYLLNLSAATNKVFLALRVIAAEAFNREGQIDDALLEEYIQKAYIAFDATYNDERLEELRVSFCEGMATGINHIIREQVDKQTGSVTHYIVDFCGVPPSDVSQCVTACLYFDNKTTFESRKPSSEVRALSSTPNAFFPSGRFMDLTEVESDDSKAVIDAVVLKADKLLTELFKNKLAGRRGGIDKEKLTATAHVRIRGSDTSSNLYGYPLEYDFGKLINNLQVVFDDSMGETHTINLGEVLPSYKQLNVPLLPGFNLSDYVRITIYREPDPMLASIYLEKLRQIREAAAENEPNNAQPQVRTQEKLLKHINNGDHLQDAARALQPVICYSMAVLIPVSIAQFITQSQQVALFDLNSWLSCWLKSAVKLESPLEPERVPLFVYPLTKAKELKDLRKSLGYLSEEGKTNEEDLFINAKGRLSYCPKSSDDLGSTGPTKFFLKFANNFLNTLYRKGGVPYTPLTLYSENVENASMSPYSNVLLLPDPTSNDNPDIDEFFAEKKRWSENISYMNGSLLTHNWDHNIIAKVDLDNDGGLVSYTDLSRASKPDIIALADFLGYPFKEYKRTNEKGEEETYNNRKTASQSLTILFPGSTYTTTLAESNNIQPVNMDFPMSHLARTSPFKAFLNAYCYYLLLCQKAGNNHLVSLEGLLQDALAAKQYKDKSIVKFDEEKTILDWSHTLKGNIYNKLLTDNITILHPSDDKIYQAFDGLKYLFDCSLREAYGTRHGVLKDLEDKGFDTNPYRLHKNDSLFRVAKVYNWFGAFVVLQAIRRFLKLDRKFVFSYGGDNIAKGFEATSLYLAGAKNSGVFGLTTLHKPSFDELSNVVYPFCLMFGHYLQNVGPIIKQAQRLIADNKEGNPDLDISEIKIPDLEKNNARLFPHQFKVQQRFNPRPRAGFLDISAGGGKTISYLVDAVRTMEEVRQAKEANPRDPLWKSVDPVVPLIVCPDNLVKSVCNEATFLLGKSWNIVPITTTTFSQTWSPEKYEELLSNPPPNTIYVTGYSFCSTKKFNISIGNRVTPVYGALEFLKKLKYNYVVFDESHFLKNQDSNRHLVAKLLASNSKVDYIRLSTGTSHPDTIKDYVGQVALFGNNIFRTKEEFIENFYQPGSKDSIRPEAPARIKDILSSYTSLVTFRRRDWAHLYPDLYTDFVKIPVAKPLNEDGTENYLGDFHQKLYEAILGRAIEDFQSAISLRRTFKRREQEIEDEVEDEGIGDLGIEEDSDLQAVSDQILKYWLQRLEQAITDPFSDQRIFHEFSKRSEQDWENERQEDLARLEKQFESKDAKKRYAELYNKRKQSIENKYDRIKKVINAVASLDNRDYINYMSPKIAECVSIAKSHFQQAKPWKNKSVYYVYDRVTHNGKVYVAKRKRKTEESPGETKDSQFKSLVPPHDEPSRWWEEKVPGRLIFITLYTKTAERLKYFLTNKGGFAESKIGMYIGTGEGSERQIEAFSKAESDVVILVANIKKIQVGHNLQIADKIVRVETPWTPGEIEQSEARIFRPSPKSGGEPRPVVYIDWLLSTPSLEVPKVARLISKMIDSYKMDEENNPIYAPLWSRDNLIKLIKMKLENLQRHDNADSDAMAKYFRVYNLLMDMNQEDIDDARLKTNMHEPLPLGDFSIPKHQDFEYLPFKPMVSGQEMKDIFNLKLVKLSEYIVQNKKALNDFAANPKSILKTKVMTQYGSGFIEAVDVSYIDKEKTRIDISSPISMVTVKFLRCYPYVGTSKMKFNPQSVFVIGDIARAKELDWLPDRPTQWRKLNRGYNSLRDAAAKISDFAKKLTSVINHQDDEISDEVTNRVTRTDNAKKSRSTADRSKPSVGIPDVESGPLKVELRPIIINNQYALVSSDSEPLDVLKEHGYKVYGNFIYSVCERFTDFGAAYAYLMSRVTAYNKEHQESSVAISDSKLEIAAVFKDLRNSLSSSPIDSLRFPVIKTTNYQAFKEYMNPKAHSDIDVFTLFSVETSKDHTDVEYVVKFCVSVMPAVAAKIGIQVRTALIHKYTFGGTEYRGKVYFQIEKSKAAKVLFTPTGAASGNKRQILQMLENEVETIQDRLGDKATIVPVKFDEIVSLYQSHIKG